MTPADIQEFMQNLGPLGWLIYLSWGTLSVVFTPLNFSAVAISAGFVYGTVWGSLGNWVCKVLGTTISFLLARKFGRGFIEKLVTKKALEKYDHFIQNERTVLLYAFFCFIPMMPSDTFAYIVGLSSLKKRAFIPITLIGHTGTAFTYAYIGSGGAWKDPLFLSIMGIAIVSGLLYIHRHRKKYALHQ